MSVHTIVHSGTKLVIKTLTGPSVNASGGAGTGDVVGPNGVTADGNVPRFNALTGNVLQDSDVNIDDSDNLTVPGTVNGRTMSTDGAKLDGIAAGAQVNPADTDSLSEGATNLYYTEARVNAASAVAANTAKVSASGSIDAHSDVDTTTSTPNSGEALIWNGSNFVPTAILTGDVVGPVVAVDEAVARYNTTSGKLIQSSPVTITDAGAIAGMTTVDGRDVGADGIVLDAHTTSLTNPHDVSAAQVGADPIGTASTAVSNHEVAGDPHSQYSTDAEVTANTAVAANTLKVSADGLVTTHSDVTNAGSGAIITGTERTKLNGIEVGAINSVDFPNLETDLADFNTIGQGIALDAASITVTSNGTTVTCNVEKSGGGDIRFVFDAGVYTLDCTPADTVTLTAGTDASPQINYVYLLESTSTLTASTSGWPATEFAPLATVLVQSAASLQAQGAYKVHVWMDHSQAHLGHINKWIRGQPATWLEGVAATPTAGAGQLDVAIGSGNVLQLHEHGVPAFDTSTGSDVYVVNDPDAAYTVVGDLTIAGGVDKDANGTTLGSPSSDFYNLVLWGVVSEVEADCKLMLNLPDGVYPNNNSGQAVNDTARTAVYAIPPEYTGTGFLIARLTIQENAGTYTVLQNEDLRGLFPNSGAGGGAASASVFADNVFRIESSADVTKEIAFDASAITTGTTRTATMPDANVDLGAIATNTTKVSAAGSIDSHSDVDTTSTPPTSGQVLEWNGSNFIPATPAGGGSSEFNDSLFRIQDNGDATKQIAFEASGLTTGTVRTVTVPDANVDLGDVNSATQPGDDADTLGSGAAADGEVLTSDGASGAAWEALPASVSRAGTTVDDTIARWNGASADSIQESNITISDDDEIGGYLLDIVIVTGTTYTMLVGNSGKFHRFTNASAVAVTLPNSFAAGWCASWVQEGAGQLTFTAASGGAIIGTVTKSAGAAGDSGGLAVLSNAGSAAQYLLSGVTA